jgi:hypothetical protein
MNHPKYQAASEAIAALFSDTSVSQGETLEALEELQADIEAKASAIRDDLGE